MNRGGAKPRRKNNPTWSTELAYICGLLITDGCLISDGRHINLTSKDLDQLETFKRCLNLSVKISAKNGSFPGSGEVFQVQFGDVVLYRWLISIGITPRKTHTVGEIQIPDTYFFDLLRGEFDGDGSSHAYWDTRWHSSVSLYISFCSASAKHLHWLNETIDRLIGTEGIVKKYGSGIFYLKFSKTKAKKLYRAMYYADHLPHLKRKKDKLDRQWIADEQAKKKIQPEGYVKNGSIQRIA